MHRSACQYTCSIIIPVAFVDFYFPLLCGIDTLCFFVIKIWFKTYLLQFDQVANELQWIYMCMCSSC